MCEDSVGTGYIFFKEISKTLKECICMYVYDMQDLL